MCFGTYQDGIHQGYCTSDHQLHTNLEPRSKLSFRWSHHSQGYLNSQLRGHSFLQHKPDLNNIYHLRITKGCFQESTTCFATSINTICIQGNNVLRVIQFRWNTTGGSWTIIIVSNSSNELRINERQKANKEQQAKSHLNKY